MAIDLNSTLGSNLMMEYPPDIRKMINEMTCLQNCPDKDAEDQARLSLLISQLGHLGVLQRAQEILEEALFDIPRARRDA